jgi:ABC-2 type transport system ATP-binding protein
MHKRLSVARALLIEPPVLLVDEATHDLDPGGAAKVQMLVRAAADEGAAVLWATQRLDEIRDFADRVTVLNQGTTRFSGTVPELMALAADRSYVLELAAPDERIEQVAAGFGRDVSLEPVPDGAGHWNLHLRGGAVLGQAVAALQQGGVDVVACREQRSGLHLAFLRLTEDA